MTERLDRADIRLRLARQRVYRRARRDLEGNVIRAADYEAPVTGSGGTSTVEAAAVNDLTWAGEHQTLTRAMERAAGILEDCLEKLTPTPTGLPCATVTDGVHCSGEATHGKLCADCAADWRPRSKMPIPADVIAARNRRRTFKCGCHERHDHEPDVCTRDLGPGQTIGRCEACRTWGRCKCGPECCPDGCPDDPAEGRKVSERCLKRRQRAKSEGEHPWQWQEVR